ncbi:hypothetical protein JCM17845_15190 [Iodidimonas gelatinilytica]|uniref:Glutamine amidotransferase type-2 domain-containing protein n=1 Tax=Iodidimonas gelatinilytica TaxID=1236966 RepID=A0A5A7N1F8_9PROT|nr:hypothetical protein JCM17845_15190 [Iodidimonas gelatinilytica]
MRAGRSAPMAKSLLVPESWSKRVTMPDAHRAMYAYCNSVMEPWDGPAALVAYDGRFAMAGLDRNGLRPLRYTVTRDGLVVVGSEAGMVVVHEEDVAEKGRLGPGQMIAVDLVEGRFYHDRDLKDQLALPGLLNAGCAILKISPILSPTIGTSLRPSTIPNYAADKFWRG